MTDTTAFDIIVTPPTEQCPDCGRTLQSSRDINDWERFDAVDCSRSYEKAPKRARDCYELTIAKLRARVSELEASEAMYRGNYLDAVERLNSAESAREGAWVPVNSGDKPAMGALVAVEVPEVGVAVGIVKPHWRTANDRRVESDEGYTYELSLCSRFCVLPAPPEAK